MNLHVFNDH